MQAKHCGCKCVMTGGMKCRFSSSPLALSSPFFRCLVSCMFSISLCRTTETGLVPCKKSGEKNDVGKEGQRHESTLPLLYSYYSSMKPRWCNSNTLLLLDFVFFVSQELPPTRRWTESGTRRMEPKTSTPRFEEYSATRLTPDDRIGGK